MEAAEKLTVTIMKKPREIYKEKARKLLNELDDIRNPSKQRRELENWKIEAQTLLTFMAIDAICNPTVYADEKMKNKKEIQDWYARVNFRLCDNCMGVYSLNDDVCSRCVKRQYEEWQKLKLPKKLQPQSN